MACKKEGVSFSGTPEQEAALKEAIAELKGITAEEVIDVTRQNAEKLLGIHQ